MTTETSKIVSPGRWAVVLQAATQPNSASANLAKNVLMAFHPQIDRTDEVRTEIVRHLLTRIGQIDVAADSLKGPYDMTEIAADAMYNIEQILRRM